MATPSHSAAQGFYVFQTALGSPLQFHPALGTSELNSLMDAYLPYPTSIQEKRASISVDFLDHYRCTGESIKFYQVPDYWVGSTSSSPSSAQDSGYGSSFTASPMAPTWSWGPALATPAASTPSTSSSVPTPQMSPRRRKQSSSARQPTSSRVKMSDFSDMPGMKILTTDGQDVTNTATRGCKTKEQRDHAHLMRIMKACGTCKKKKVRCDPSHRTIAGATSPASPIPRQAKKARISTQQFQPGMAVPSFEPVISDNSAPILPLADTFELDVFDPTFLHETPAEDADWEEFLRSNGELDSMLSGGLDCLTDIQPGIQSAPPRPPVLSMLPDPSDLSSAIVKDGSLLVPDIPKLPYMEMDEAPHTYVDFNLYSPSSSFSDMEPVFSGDMTDNSVSRRAQALQQQPSGALVNEPWDCADTRPSDHGQSSLSSQQESLLQSNSDSVATLASRSSPSSPTSPIYDVLPDVNGGSDPNDPHSSREENASWSPTLRSPRIENHSAVVSQVPAINARESSALGGCLSPSQSFTTTRQDNTVGNPSGSLAARADLQRLDGGAALQAVSAGRADLQRIDGGAGRQAVSGERKRGSFTTYQVMESGLVHPGTTESTAMLDRTVPKALSALPLKALPCTASSTILSTGQYGSENCHIDVGFNQPTTTTSDLCQSSLGIVFVSAIAAAFTLATALRYITTCSLGIDVFAASSNLTWMTLCAVAYTVSRQGKKAGSSGIPAKGLWTRRTVARVGSVLSRIPIFV